MTTGSRQRRSKRRAVRIIALLGVVALAVAGWFAFRLVLEQRYILWLESPDEAVREKAAEKLAEL